MKIAFLKKWYFWKLLPAPYWLLLHCSSGEWNLPRWVAGSPHQRGPGADDHAGVRQGEFHTPLLFICLLFWKWRKKIQRVMETGAQRHEKCSSSLITLPRSCSRISLTVKAAARIYFDLQLVHKMQWHVNQQTFVSSGFDHFRWLVYRRKWYNSLRFD